MRTFQVLQGNYQEAFEIFRSGPPKNGSDHQPDDALFRAQRKKTIALCVSVNLGKYCECACWKGHGREERQRSLAFQFPRGLASDIGLDFDGTRRICDTILQAKAEYPTGQRRHDKPRSPQDTPGLLRHTLNSVSMNTTTQSNTSDRYVILELTPKFSYIGSGE